VHGKKITISSSQHLTLPKNDTR